MGNLLSREVLLSKQSLQVQKVDLGDDDYVFVREMTARERDTFEQSLTKANRNSKGVVVGYDQQLGDFRAKMAVVTLCDESGTLLLKPEDYAMLSQNMGIKRMELIVNEAQKLNKITDEDKEELIKNSGADQAGNSSSDSAEN